jgi:hypothetical protein
MKHIASTIKPVRAATTVRPQDPERGTKSVRVGCGLECHWGGKRLRARVIAFVNDGAGLTGVVRRLFRQGR